MEEARKKREVVCDDGEMEVRGREEKVSVGERIFRYC